MKNCTDPSCGGTTFARTVDFLLFAPLLFLCRSVFSWKMYKRITCEKSDRPSKAAAGMCGAKSRRDRVCYQKYRWGEVNSLLSIDFVLYRAAEVYCLKMTKQPACIRKFHTTGHKVGCLGVPLRSGKQLCTMPIDFNA